MYRVSKVLNNNGIIAINMEENQEYVLLGKGVGFGRRSASVLRLQQTVLFTGWLRRQNVAQQRTGKERSTGISGDRR